ncbi:MAG: hypothetical protein HPY82_18895 [Gammaproteobacteria bacterium]|nr:hypothetical protein [Gammaproteobacteria bacterium]
MKIGEPLILPHWNYFLCLEEDVIRLSRWIEIAEGNFQCYSIEIARLLMASSSEVDVVAKLVCKSIDSESKADNINAYQNLLTARYPTIKDAHTAIPRYGISLYPWRSWAEEKSPPEWWIATNKVKHHRSEYFEKASLINLLNSMSGLLILITLLYRDKVHKLYPLTELFIPKSFLLNMGESKVRFTDKA